MVMHIYQCQRCGKEKEVMLQAGEKPEDIICGCGSTKTAKSSGIFDLLKMGKSDHSQAAQGLRCESSVEG